MTQGTSAAQEREIDRLRRRLAELEALDAERRRIEHDLVRRTELESVVSAVSQRLLRRPTEDHARQIDFALDRLACYCGARRAIACALDPDRHGLRTIRRWPAGEVPAAGEAELLDVAGEELARSALERIEPTCVQAAPHCLLVAPMLCEGVLFGALAIEKPAPFDELHITLVRSVADILAGVVARSRMQAEIRRLNRELEERVLSRTAALQASLGELESFSYSVSHDLRSPLRAINGYAHLLLEDYAARLDDTARSYLERIRSATERMGTLIDDLLNLSRISRAATEPVEVDLSAMATEILREHAQAEPQRRVEAHVQPGLRAVGDASLLRVAMENLIGNAWKFSGREPKALIEVGITESAHGSAFYVRDNGSGFDPAYAEKLFRPFQRLHEVDEFPGSGIGLATVKRIIDRHGGSIWASGEPGRGATFCFTLPGSAPRAPSADEP
ncbi:MAG: hypothetical protein Fur0039_19950 [Rhodocyclaceae bacterium]